MRVLYDGVAFQNSYQRGIQRAFRELIDRLPSSIEAVVALTDAPRCDLPRRARVARAGLRCAAILPRGLRRRVQRRLAPPALARIARGCDVFHSTYFTLAPDVGGRGRAASAPTVVHVHDLIPERYPRFFDSEWAAREVAQRKRCIERADRVIAISDATAREIAHFYPAAKDKTTTIYWGWEHLRPGREDARTSVGPAYALCVGDRAGYKNFAVVLEAMRTGAWPRDVALTVVGPAWTPEEMARVEPLGRTRRIQHAGRVPDTRLAGLYGDAACVIAPSISEGFGFSLLEAQGAGTPVVCSDTPVFREIAGAGALFFDPENAEELASCVQQAAEPGVRARLVSSGRGNLERFAWDRCAAQVAAVYRSIA